MRQDRLVAAAATVGNFFISRPLSNNLHTKIMMSSTNRPSFGKLRVEQFPCLNDNYGFLIHDVATGQTAAIDVPESAAYKAKLNELGWKLTHIFNTHHHWDHTGGNLDLKCVNDDISVYGSQKEQSKTPGITKVLKDGDVFEFGTSKAVVMEVGGHTLGHIAYYFPNDKTIFVGDSLFSLGCGRMMEGTPSQFWKSLTSLRALPDETTVYW
jgi:hydroxyacylglutathione hydrolase